MQANPAHRRSHLVAATPSGLEAFRRLHADEIAALAGVAEGIDRDDLRTCAEVLQRLTDAIAGRVTGQQDASGRMTP